MTITIEEEVQIPFSFDYKETANRVINAAIDSENFPYESEINLFLVDNETIAKMNQNYREIERPTDVLSFPMIAYDTPGDFSKIEDSTEDNFNPDTGELILGDIVISVPKVLEQAEEYGHSTEREFAFLITHSMLHLFGYDHMEPEEAAIMEHKQKAILDSLQITR